MLRWWPSLGGGRRWSLRRRASMTTADLAFVAVADLRCGGRLRLRCSRALG
jgi:hypothetical protein